MAIRFSKELRSVDDLSEEAREDLKLDLEAIADSIVEDARSHHRFESQTGALEASVNAEATEDTIRAWLDVSVAPYAVYIHDGTRKWVSDPFLEKAFTAHMPEVNEAIERATMKTLERF